MPFEMIPGPVLSWSPDGDHHDVNCLRTLAYDYYPNGVQGRAH